MARRNLASLRGANEPLIVQIEDGVIKISDAAMTQGDGAWAAAASAEGSLLEPALPKESRASNGNPVFLASRWSASIIHHTDINKRAARVRGAGDATPYVSSAAST